jgi:putative phosphoesterase
LLRPEALAALEGCERIIHAGDIGDAAILRELRRLAPVAAVRGNNDRDEWARAIPGRRMLRVGGVRILVIHDVHELRGDPAPAGVRVVVAGHSHKPVIREEGAMLFVNPGSAGPRRFRLPVSVGFLEVAGDRVRATLRNLEPA